MKNMPKLQSDRFIPKNTVNYRKKRPFSQPAQKYPIVISNHFFYNFSVLTTKILNFIAIIQKYLHFAY